MPTEGRCLLSTPGDKTRDVPGGRPKALALTVHVTCSSDARTDKQEAESLA
jgi:hypothetical protein